MRVFGVFSFLRVHKRYTTAYFLSVFSHQFSSDFTTSFCLFGYKCEYVCKVVLMSSCPKRSLIKIGEQPSSTYKLAWLWRRSCTWIFLISLASIPRFSSCANHPFVTGNNLCCLFSFCSVSMYWRRMTQTAKGNTIWRLLLGVLGGSNRSSPFRRA